MTTDAKSCKHCGQLMSAELIADRKKLHSLRISQSLKDAKARGENVGRPILIDRDMVRRLRARGFSIRQIAKKLDVAASSVQSALQAIEKETK